MSFHVTLALTDRGIFQLGDIFATHRTCRRRSCHIAVLCPTKHARATDCVIDITRCVVHAADCDRRVGSTPAMTDATRRKLRLVPCQHYVDVKLTKFRLKRSAYRNLITPLPSSTMDTHPDYLERVIGLAQINGKTHENTSDAGAGENQTREFIDIKRQKRPTPRNKKVFYAVNDTFEYCAAFPPRPGRNTHIFAGMFMAGAGLHSKARPAETVYLGDYDPAYALGPVGNDVRILAARSADEVRSRVRAQANNEGRLLVEDDHGGWQYKDATGNVVIWLDD